MFDLSLAEILVVIVVAVVFIGPKELPAVVRAIAKALAALRGFSREVRNTFDDLAEESGLKTEIKMIQGDDGKWYESYPTEITPPKRKQAMTELPKQPIMTHLVELRTRLMISLAVFLAATIVCYFFAADIYGFLVAPLAHAFPEGESRRMIYTSLTEAFFTYLKLAVFAGFIASFPMFAVQFYRFLSPGLYAKEKRAMIPYLAAAPVLFLVGAAFVYYLIFPAAWKFFLGFESTGGQGLPIQLEAKVSEYLSLSMHLILAFGLSFQLPVVLVLLVKSGLVQLETLKKGRRYAIVAIVAVAAVITPPDVFSQIALSVPLYVLYELAILFCRNVKEPKDA